MVRSASLLVKMFPVAGDQVVQRGGLERGLAGVAGGGCGIARLDEQAGHLRRPVLLAWLEVVQALQIPEQVGPRTRRAAPR